jgi:uncharacterized protein DUF6159
MNKLQRSWTLFKCSVSVVLQNKKLLVFPALSFVFTMIILSLAITPVAFQSTGYKLDQGEHWKAVGSSLFATKSVAEGDSSTTKVTPKPLAIGIGVGIYMLAMFLATFFNVAFFHQILQALKGAPVSVGAGFKFAVSKLKGIALWSLFAGLIGLIIKVLEERLEAVGQLIMRFLGLAWSVASVFVIPVLIVEPGSNPFDVLRKSAATLKKTWGETLAGYLGLQFGRLRVFLFSILFLGGAVAASIMSHNGWILLGGVVLWIFALVVFAYLTNVASQVYRCALYIYAAEGAIPQPYNDELLQMAWKLKKS